jgi:pre-mRNA-processing factor 17
MMEKKYLKHEWRTYRGAKRIIKANRTEKIKEEEKLQEIKNLNFQPSTIFHLEQDSDYQGRSYLEPPPNLKNVDHTRFIPKRLVNTFVGHTKSVHAIEFFPEVGHFILSCSLDGKVKLWDLMTHKKCVRTYIGHQEGVRDICFSNEGTKFLSASFNKNIQLWDTEYGKVINTFTNKKIPFCVVFSRTMINKMNFLSDVNKKKFHN